MTEENTGKKVLAAMMILLAIVLFVFVLRIVCTPVEQETRIHEKTIDADNVVHNYEFFKQQAQDIKATDAKIKTAQTEMSSFKEVAGDRDEWDYNDKNEYARLTANVTGLKNYRNEQVATYNARAKMANRSIFKTKELPESFETLP